MTMDADVRFGRIHLEWPEKVTDVPMHRAAWDRLRQVCRELGCSIPTMDEINEMKMDMPESEQAFVIVKDTVEENKVKVNFEIGYKQSNKFE